MKKNINLNSNIIQANFTKPNQEEKLKQIQTLIKNKTNSIFISEKALKHLQKNNIKFYEDIKNISDQKIRDFLIGFLDSSDKYYIMFNTYESLIDPQRKPAEIVKLFSKNEKELEIKLRSFYITEKDLSTISNSEPDPEILQKMRKSMVYEKMPMLFKNNSNIISQEDLDKISDKEVLESYYNSLAFMLDKQKHNEYIKTLSNEEVKNKYQDQLNQLEKEKEFLKEFSNNISELIGLGQDTYKGLPTYNSLLKGTTGKQKGKLSEIKKEKEEKLDLLVKLIMSDESLTNTEKENALREVDNENNKNLEYEINQWLGKKLTKKERRVLRVLRGIIYQMIEHDEIKGYVENSLYEAEILLSRIYDDYGLKGLDDGSYDSRQKKVIQDILFGFSTKGLHEDILFKHREVERTRYILKVKEVNNNMKQRIGIIVTVPHFLFISQDNPSNYYYQDKEGFKRFMAIKGMAQSDAAFNIAEYLEWFLSNKFEERIIDIETLIKEAGEDFLKLYKTHRKKTVDNLKTILKNMCDSKYLISEYILDEKGGKYKQGQIVLKNARYNVINISNYSRKTKCKVN